MSRLFIILAVLCLICGVSARRGLILPSEDSTTVKMLVAYCPTDFTGAGAIVDINALTGEWSVAIKFKFPSGVFGCVADFDPTYDYDPNDKDILWFDFTSDAGYFVSINMKTGDVQVVNSPNWFFTGFVNFKYFMKTQQLRGVTPTVTQNGFCFDGCMRWGSQDVGSEKKYTADELIPFKAAMDDTSYLDEEKGIFYFQASYDLREQTCGPASDSECMLAINASTGKLLKATYTPQYTVYKFSHRQHVAKVQQPPARAGPLKVLAWMNGFDSLCKDPYNDFLFGLVNLDTSEAKPVACIHRNVTIHMDEWISSFSLDDKLFATGSGNSEGTDAQFVVFNTTSGNTVLDTRLKGLPQALGADMKLIFVWALEFY